MPTPTGVWRTRFAPAPTGYLHLGHAVNAMHVWGMARAFAGTVVLRVEDHDRSRCRPEFERALLDDLDWLGLVPDLGTTGALRSGPSEYRQSDNPHRYASALASLAQRGLVYACTCTRRDIAMQSIDDSAEESRYPGTCANAGRDESATSARRVRLGDHVVQFEDGRLGLQRQHPSEQCGDLLVKDRLGQWTYQFAVTVDDLYQNIDVIIRGEDLLPSTGRQFALARLLGRKVLPKVWHHALVRRADGRKLSKSLGDTAIHEMRRAGLSAADVFGQAAFTVGLIDSVRPITAEALAELFQNFEHPMAESRVIV